MAADYSMLSSLFDPSLLGGPAIPGAPKMEKIPGVSTGSGGGGALSGSLLASVSELINAGIAPHPKNLEFYSKAKSLKTENAIEGVRGKLGTLAFSTGNPIAMAVAGGDMLGRAVDKAAKDDYGVYKSTFGGIADRVLDPIGDITDLFTPGSSQKKRRIARDSYFQRKDTNEWASQKERGYRINNSLPSYQAPPYGRRGLKFKTKFSR